jgi:hypothetical protein
MTGHSDNIKKHVKKCEQCSETFFMTTNSLKVFCDTDEDAYFCSPYCEALWLTDQFDHLNEYLFDSSSSDEYDEWPSND